MAEKSENEIRAEAEQVSQHLDLKEMEARSKGQRFERLDEQTLLKKLSGEEANSPFIISIGWSSAPPGGTTGFSVTIHNPDPFPYSEFSLFAYTVFGAANTIQSVDLSLTAVDARFPRYWRGLGVAAGGSATASFTIAVPAGITPGVYFGNCYLVRRASFDAGQVFQRACFDLEVL